MKLNENYILKTVAGTPVVVPVGDAVKNIRGMISLNGPAEIIWKALEKGCSTKELAEELTQKYEVSHEQASKDAEEFMQKLREIGCLEEE